MRSSGGLPSPASARKRSTTTSTTRTSFLCSVASSMSRAAPLRTSPASCSRVFASDLPKRLGSMWCSSSMRENMRRSLASPAASAATRAALPSTPRTPDLVARSLLHHSNLSFAPRMARSSTKNSLTSWCCSCSGLLSWPSASRARALCSTSNRLRSSWRRSLTCSSAPSCTMPGTLASPSSLPSTATSAETSGRAAIHGCAIISSAAGRFLSCFSSILLMNSSHVACTRLGIRTSLDLTSFSSRKGKRPLTRPYMMTPIAHTSTLAP
mmetsp:Transcript_30408/g.83792  ORF Transcript_30408/g.83792 Transcript_30408/m.83792 type:complete len:268 (+) Transcript_30408:1009-1812(+)